MTLDTTTHLHQLARIKVPKSSTERANLRSAQLVSPPCRLTSIISSPTRHRATTTCDDRSYPTRQMAIQKTTRTSREYFAHITRKRAGPSPNGFHQTQRAPNPRPRRSSHLLRRCDNRDKHRQWAEEVEDSAICGTLLRRNSRHKNHCRSAEVQGDVAEEGARCKADPWATP